MIHFKNSNIFIAGFRIIESTSQHLGARINKIFESIGNLVEKEKKNVKNNYSNKWKN